MCICAHACVCTCVYMSFYCVGCGDWLNSGCTSWSAESFPVEPSRWPWLLRWHFMSCSCRVFLPPPLLTLTTFSFLSSWSYRCVPLATLVHYIWFNLTKVSEHRRMPPDSSPEYRWNVFSSWCSETWWAQTFLSVSVGMLTFCSLQEHSEASLGHSPKLFHTFPPCGSTSQWQVSCC